MQNYLVFYRCGGNERKAAYTSFIVSAESERSAYYIAYLDIAIRHSTKNIIIHEIIKTNKKKLKQRCDDCRTKNNTPLNRVYCTQGWHTGVISLVCNKCMSKSKYRFLCLNKQ